MSRGGGFCGSDPAGSLEEQQALLSHLFARGIATSGRDPRHVTAPANAAEELLVAGASPRRKREFWGGRACARDALRAFDRADQAVLRGKRGEPLWPDGVIGSISHAEVFCAAVVASSDDYLGVGVDVELDGRVSPEFARRVCSPKELARCAEFGPVDELASVVFSAKESAYKLQYPASQTVLYWRDLEVLLHEGAFTVRVLTNNPPFGSARMLVGRWARGAGLIVSGIALKRDESSGVCHKRPF
ncbi:MAG: 4'-phosphopantetheinyl transferase superfamily protein [Polyangiaceae bacterium]